MITNEQEQAFNRAYEATAAAYNAHDLGQPPEPIPDAYYPSTFFHVLGGAYVADEFPPIDYIPNMVEGNKEYFAGVQAAIQENADNPSPETIRLGEACGRWMVATAGIGLMRPTPAGVRIEEHHLVTDEARVPLELVDKNVIEYGMGMKGLWSHKESLVNGRYAVTHIGASRLENIVLRGIAEQYDIPESLLRLEHGGIASTVKDLAMSSDYSGKVDVIIGSRVHGAPDLAVGIEYARSNLLRAGGLLALRGPKNYKHGTSYEEAAEVAIREFGPASVLADEHFMHVTSTMTTEPDRTLIVRNPGE